MKIVNRLFDMARRRYGQHGSALLVSLMVMVGLSLLGLSFVAISETESAISAHERDGDQTLDVAEAGAKMVVEWFQDPQWAKDNNILPPNDESLKTKRRFMSGGNEVHEFYKMNEDTMLLFDKPFAQVYDKFFGTEQTADVIIDYKTDKGIEFLNKLNKAMFATNDNVTGDPQRTEGGGIRITEIRVYAPPIIGGNINGYNFWDDTGTPYGLATIKVTAQKFGPNDIAKTDLSQGKAIATRYVKMVVAPWPFPGPQGPIQSNANINTGGAVGVHWGKMTSEGSMYIKNPLTSMNWYDAWDRAHIEHGYLSSAPWQATHAYEVGDVVHPTSGTDTKIDGSTIVWTCTTAGTSSGTEPNWSAGPPVLTPTPTVVSDGATLKWTASYPKAFQNNSASATADQYNWLYQIVGKTYQDPWFEARARGQIINTTNNQFQSAVGAAATDPQPLPYDDPAKDPVNIPDYGYSCWFQNQTVTDPRPSHRKQVVFPRIDYNFWKDIAVSGNGTQGVYYLQWVSGMNFTNGVTTKNMGQWVNTVNQGQPGFYFFDTQNKQNPQGPGAAGILTPAINLNSGVDGNTFQMQGFIYLNCTFGTNGIGGPDGYQNYPGEPYRDVGYRDVAIQTKAADPSTNPPTVAQTRGSFSKDASGNPVWDSVGDGIWDYQDLPWSNSGTDGTSTTNMTGNGKFDVYVKQRNIRLADGTQETVWLPVDWYPGCHPGDNKSISSTDTLACSEPHEPYINLQYYNAGNGLSRALSSPGSPQSVTVGWVDPSTEIYLKKKLVSGAPISSCNYAATYDWWQSCTSNAYDRDGPLVDDIKPVLNGVLYMEGDMQSQGNASYYGSVLINGNVDDQGTPDVWFDESLIKNTWPPSTMKFPRVYVSSVQTDEQQ